ncbi:MAG: trigger factor, partial [Muribaculaceae bacterium]|nr:trigger factor [Muribaculaceae bacterium]
LIVRNEELNKENIDAEFEKMVPGIRWELLSNQIRANQDVKVTDEDMVNFAKGLVYNQFMQYGMTNLTDDVLTDYAKKVLSDKQQARRIHDDVSERKLFNVVKALVTVEEKELSLDEFKAMVNPEAAAE